MNARISAVLVALVLVTGAVAAQERFGTLQGKVTDPQGSAVPGVTVTVTEIQTGASRVFVSDTNGQYLAADLTPGRYNVAFEKAHWAAVFGRSSRFD